MEFFDIINPDGTPTGKTKSNKDVHRDGDWHRTVHIWILNSQQQLLIQKRAAGMENYANMWHISVAGHMSAGDDALTTVLKEASEELDITVDPKNLEYLFEAIHQDKLSNGTYIINHRTHVYLLPINLDIATVKLQPEEVSEVKWVNFRELENLIATKKIDMVDHGEEYQKLFAILHKRFP